MQSNIGKVMIFKHPNSRCREKASRKVLPLGSVLCFVFFSFASFASSINKPASPVMDHAVGDDLEVGRGAISKSRVVPLKRKMDLATTKSSGAGKMQSVKSVKQHKLAQSDSGQLNKDGNSSDLLRPMQDKVKIKSKEDSQAPRHLQAGETWDSSATRYDQSDPAKTVTKGVRVEDIIEPTFEYRYSSARRKNPFIPEVILTGKTARQRELSPNDVEIPIVSPLQSFAVSRLAVIGVWETDNGVWKALIRTPATQGIEAKLGDPIGNSGGRLMTINPDSVVVREFSVRTDGTREYRDIPLYMGSDLPSGNEDQTGGRLILRPGATQPEIVPPQAAVGSPTDSVISVTPQTVRGDLPGTLKTVESVPAAATMAPLPSGASANENPPIPVRDAAQAVNPPSSQPSANGNPTETPPVGMSSSEPVNTGVNLEQATPAMGGQQ